MEFALGFGSSKNDFGVAVGFLEETMFVIKCYLRKIRIWHPCLSSQLIFFYLSVKSWKQRPIDQKIIQARSSIGSMMVTSAICSLGRRQAVSSTFCGVNVPAMMDPNCKVKGEGQRL